jgi:hypothetical protein
MWAIWALPFIVLFILAFLGLSIYFLIENWRDMLCFWAFSFVGVVILIVMLGLLNFFTSKTVLTPDDYQGSYIVNRDYFSGKQSDWQYNHFRFNITGEDSIFFYETENEKIINTFKGTVSYSKSRESARLKISNLEPSHHVLSGNPTTYRNTWDFYLVFNSPKFYNMYFKKGIWKPIN